jgi:hypothetical protein
MAQIHLTRWHQLSHLVFDHFHGFKHPSLAADEHRNDGFFLGFLGGYDGREVLRYRFFFCSLTGAHHQSS